MYGTIPWLLNSVCNVVFGTAGKEREMHGPRLCVGPGKGDQLLYTRETKRVSSFTCNRGAGQRPRLKRYTMREADWLYFVLMDVCNSVPKMRSQNLLVTPKPSS